MPPAGYFCLQRQKYPKTPLETTFQDFLSALRPVSNLPHVPRAIAFPVFRCPSKGLCRHSFPLPLRCRCLLPRQPLPPLPPYRGTPHPTQPPSLELSFQASPQAGVGIRPPKAPSGALYIVRGATRRTYLVRCSAPHKARFDNRPPHRERVSKGRGRARPFPLDASRGWDF